MGGMQWGAAATSSPSLPSPAVGARPAAGGLGGAPAARGGPIGGPIGGRGPTPVGGQQPAAKPGQPAGGKGSGNLLTDDLFSSL